ncbi:dihydroorotate dehydrogenase [uncultured Peptoniphilus sp.]|uniref:dihydroorotate dehydrogenase n=1 Tax=uncultured Peptoniphilus sp. TaxID=254354 RepID=UPI0025849592|nr:dihydroorotate dehydrogenase [uncultured Peptoniphilus sp.]MDU6783501.1 dihydroorotate dehydrogenase [Peptoniphilus harei]
MTSRSEIDLAGIKLKNPIIMASGTYGYGEEFKNFYDPKILGGISSKGITRHPKKGNEGIRIWETPSGILNSIGLENPGVEEFVKEKIYSMQELGTEIFVNLGGNTIDEYVESTKILNDYEFAAIELNISCPNVKEGGMAFGMDKDSAAKVVREVMKVTNKKVFVKLSPNAGDIVGIAKAVEAEGATGLSLINTILGMAIDFDREEIVFNNTYAGLSGPAVKPIALRILHQVARAVDIPIIGMGGITSYKDVLEFLMVGATAVEIGTYNFMNPKAGAEIISDLEKYLEEKNKDIKDYIKKLV